MDRKSENIFSPKYSHSKRPISQNWFYGILILNILTANYIFNIKYTRSYIIYRMLESLHVVARIEYVKIFNNFDTVAEWLTRRPAKPFSS